MYEDHQGHYAEQFQCLCMTSGQGDVLNMRMVKIFVWESAVPSTKHVGMAILLKEKNLEADFYAELH